MDNDLKQKLINKLTFLSGYLEGIGWIDNGNLGDALIAASEHVTEILKLLEG